MASNLVIVESPAKAKTIKQYLGKNYSVIASMGHVRDLPKSQMGIDFENDFQPKYITIRGKGDLITKLKKEAKSASKVYLATDPDREGEAISWHLAQLLDIPVSVIRPGAVKTGLLNASNVALDRFIDNTKLYLTNAKRFRTIVDSVESRHIPAEKIAELALEALESKHPKYVYNINRNPLLLLLNMLPARLQVLAIGLVLKV